MSKILRVDLTSGRSEATEANAAEARMGGRGLIAAILGAEVDPAADPLGPENVLVLATGLLAGTSVPNSGRLSVGGKSPLTGGIKEANSGGTAARRLAGLGMKAVAFSGAAPELSLVHITSEGTDIRPAPQLAGLGTYETTARLREEYGERAGIVCIGPAGEMQLKAAAVIVSSPDGRPRSASRGGLGAVMGAKNIKAVVVDDTGGPGVAVAHPEALKAATSTYSEAIRAHGFAQGLGAMGTGMLINVANSMGCLATKSYSAGSFDSAEAISGEEMHGRMTSRPNAQTSHRCMAGCLINCSQVYTDEQGEEITSGFEFESLTLLGANCAISDLDQVARLDRLCDDLGLDTIETGAALGVAMEGGMLPWGDGAAAIALLNGLPAGAANSLLIGNGCVATGQALDVERIPAVKGQSLAAWEPRVLKGTGVTYATSPMGADHTCGNALPSPNLPEYNPSSAEGQAQMSQFLQAFFAGIDTLGLCLFAAIPSLDDPSFQDTLAQAVTAVTGEPTGEGYLIALGAEVVRAEKAFNRAAGFTAADDRLPAFMAVEALPPSGNVFDVSEADLDSVFAD